MQATHEPLLRADDALRVGDRVSCQLRGGAVGVVKAEPFHDIDDDRRSRVWVDYTASCGVVGIDYVRDLRVLQ